MGRTRTGDAAGPDEPKGEVDESGSFASLVGDVARFEPVSRSGSRHRPPAPPRLRDATAPTEFHFPDPLEPRFGRAKGCSERAHNLLFRGEPAPAERIDLHGLDREAARKLLSRRLDSAVARNLACVLVIHGHGRRSAEATAVLKQALPGWLTSAPCAKAVQAFAPARQRDGGQGATYVLLAPARGSGS